MVFVEEIKKTFNSSAKLAATLQALLQHTPLPLSKGDEVVLETLDPLKPATLKGTDHPEFLYLLMPVRIS